MAQKNNLNSLKIKKTFLFVFCLSFFFIPSQNWYAVVQANNLPSLIQEVKIDLPKAAYYPVNLWQEPFPTLTARAFVVVDRDSSSLMAGRNENLRVLPASTVKVMTALVALDNYSLDEVLTVGELKDNGQDIKLLPGEKITVRNLLYGLLVASGNDVAMVLAQNYPGGTVAFVKEMNEKAEDLNLNHTYFANPTGLDSDPEGNLFTDLSYTSALDLAHLAATALKNDFLLEIFSTRSITITDIEGKISHKMDNINELLNYFPGMKGVKTGFTQEAGECLVGYTEQDNRGIITVILGSQDRFGETVKLTNWIFENFRWTNLIPSI